MRANGIISERQFAVLIFLYTIGTTILVIPSGLASAAGQDAWIGALIGIVLGWAALGVYAWLWRMYPDKTFVGMCEAALGRPLGKCLSVAFVFGSFIGSTTVLYYEGNFFNIQILPHTPIGFINVLFAVVVVFGVRLGLESIARTAELMLPWFLILFLVLVATLTPQIRFDELRPVMEAGIKRTVWAGLSVAGTAYLPIFYLFAITPSVRNPAKARRAMLLAASAGGLCVVVITVLCVLVLGPDITSRSMFPSYALVKKINIGNFLQRIEALMAGLWFITTYIKTTFYFYGWVTSFSELLNLRNYRTVTMPFGIILVVFSLIVYPDVAYMQNWDSTVYLPYITTIGFVLPLMVLGIGLLRKSGR